MVAESRLAASAYQNLARLSEELGDKKSGKIVGAEDTGGDFGGMVSDVVNNFSQQAKSADAQTQALAAGKADLVDVVTAVAETQVAMETLVSVRDQIISAYEKIMAMPI
ncbi:MAG: flagellar hook-basal body complex protein FliE [Pseudomonadota bacterium]